MIIEACVETLDQSVMAQNNGAHRLELCDRLDLGGLSPSISLIEQVLDKVFIPIKVMVRSRSGDFIYSKKEVDEMIAYIKKVSSLGINEFVFGCMTVDLSLDLAAINRITESCPDGIFTIHKAIDACNDPVLEIEGLKDIGNIKYILTSGGAATALEGQKVLREMIVVARPEITIIAAGKVTRNNLEEVDGSVKTTEYHGRRIVF